MHVKSNANVTKVNFIGNKHIVRSKFFCVIKENILKISYVPVNKV